MSLDEKAASGARPDRKSAARFLLQATLGGGTAEIDGVCSLGFERWIEAQFQTEPSITHEEVYRHRSAGMHFEMHHAWWRQVLTADDLLRQRMAVALTEIFVVSEVAIEFVPWEMMKYYDDLGRMAFGNWRDLLRMVTLHPLMGHYLSHLRNRKPDPALQRYPDENYAREVMQLFTIGLNQLNPDGSLALDHHGQPVPTYDQATIVQTANALTGWSYAAAGPGPSFYGAAPDWFDPMQLYPAYHDDSAKTIVGGTVLPAGEGGAADLTAALDALFQHPNTGPFICRQLIQRLVTSNPSAGYVYRVSQVFADDGTGTRGTLAAVIPAILLDYEARSPALLAQVGYGKLKEPLLRETALFRAFAAASAPSRFPLFTPDQDLGQAPLRSPTVFNFFLPDYEPPGPLAAAACCAPEFQITTAATAVSVANTLAGDVYSPVPPAPSTVVLDLSALTAAPDDPTLVATLNLLLCGGNLSAAAQQLIISGLASLPAGSTLPADRARFALALVLTAPGGAVQQ